MRLPDLDWPLQLFTDVVPLAVPALVMPAAPWEPVLPLWPPLEMFCRQAREVARPERCAPKRAA